MIMLQHAASHTHHHAVLHAFIIDARRASSTTSLINFTPHDTMSRAQVLEHFSDAPGLFACQCMATTGLTRLPFGVTHNCPAHCIDPVLLLLVTAQAAHRELTGPIVHTLEACASVWSFAWTASALERTHEKHRRCTSTRCFAARRLHVWCLPCLCRQ